MEIKEPAPIVIFAHIRVNHLRNLLESLGSNRYIRNSKVFFFIDGPRENTNDEYYINQVQNLANDFQNFCRSITITKQTENIGVAKSEIQGINYVFKFFDRVIVLEDDLLVAKNFLEYMNVMLRQYANEDRVMGVSGYRMAIGKNFEDTFFLPTLSSWGWGTWRRAWNKLDTNPKRLLQRLKHSGTAENFNFGVMDKMQLLKKQISGDIDSWAILFNATIAIHNGLVIWPGKTLVQNTGFNDEATHTKTRTHRHIHKDWTIDKVKIDYSKKRPEMNWNKIRSIQLEINKLKNQNSNSKIKSLIANLFKSGF